MTKIHLGRRGSEVGFWVAADGWDASTPGDKMIFDSNRDALNLHEVKSARWNGDWDDLEAGYLYGEKTVTFTALPYRPLVFTTIKTPRAAGEIYYPPASVAEGSFGVEIFEAGGSVDYSILTDRITVRNTQFYISQWSYMDLTIYVYKNRLVP